MVIKIADLEMERLRRETPGCEQVLHFNNAGAALMPTPVYNTVQGYLEEEFLCGGYETARKHEGRIQQVYHSVARLLNASADEIALVENATRAWDMVFYAIPFQPGDIVLTTTSEYASNFIAFLQLRKKTGLEVEVIPNDASGEFSVTALEKRLQQSDAHRIRLIAVNHIPTHNGLVNPAEAIGRLARQYEVLYLLDACQSVGQMPLDVARIGCDFLSATSRKFLRGPRGAGFLYVRRSYIETLEPPFLDLHAATWTAPDQYEIRRDARRFETWEADYAARIGMGRAVDYALEIGLEAIQRRVQSLAETLRMSLAGLPGIVVQDRGETRCGIVTFTHEAVEPGQMMLSLAEKRINVSVSPAAYALQDMADSGVAAVVRASVHYYNTEEEISRFCKALESLLPS